jgi:hypothetical protein
VVSRRRRFLWRRREGIDERGLKCSDAILDSLRRRSDLAVAAGESGCSAFKTVVLVGLPTEKCQAGNKYSEKRGDADTPHDVHIGSFAEKRAS